MKKLFLCIKVLKEELSKQCVTDSYSAKCRRHSLLHSRVAKIMLDDLILKARYNKKLDLVSSATRLLEVCTTTQWAMN